MNANDPMSEPGFIPLLPVGTNRDDALSLYVDVERPPHHDALRCRLSAADPLSIGDPPRKGVVAVCAT